MSILYNYTNPFNLFDYNNNITNIFPYNNIDRYPYITYSLTQNYPKVDDDRYTYTMNIPGMSKEDVNVSITNRVVSVKAEKTDDTEGTYNKYTKSYHLPEDVDEDQIQATVVDGIFKMVVKRKVPETISRTINVE